MELQEALSIEIPALQAKLKSLLALADDQNPPNPNNDPSLEEEHKMWLETAAGKAYTDILKEAAPIKAILQIRLGMGKIFAYVREKDLKIPRDANIFNTTIALLQMVEKEKAQMVKGKKIITG